MGILEAIINAVRGTPGEQVAPGHDPIDDAYLGTDQATTGVVPDVSTPANDPALRDVAAAGAQPVSKPTEIEAAKNPTARDIEREVIAPQDPNEITRH